MCSQPFPSEYRVGRRDGRYVALPMRLACANISDNAGGATIGESERLYSTPGRLAEGKPSLQDTRPFEAPVLTPHPFTNQDIVAVARGTIVYCVEDVDNPWVDDHFKVSQRLDFEDVHSML